ncbi:MAG TPA: peptidoglycan editing factor PgeF [Thiobacillaceae bacterium]|nr:peptidoglycan editing factor PgeF [Thiobacillaceae bacterium]HNA83319.1 peptidoglycan editing factor PgeF [Thiobacillaceae bacterium]
MHPDWLVPDWPAPANVRALTTTRAGGVSGPPYDSLNPASHVGDEPAAVAENRRILRQALPAEPLWLNQVHGTRVFELLLPTLTLPTRGEGTYTSPASGGGREGENPAGPTLSGPGPFQRGNITPEADASFTLLPGLVCAVLTADCLPVLFCDDAGTVVAAAHAGWRGLAGGVLEETVKAMKVAPDRILAWLGPAIGPESFEVGPEVREAFVAHNDMAGIAFRPALPGTLDEAPRKWLADIYRLARIRLAGVGVERVHGGGACTLKDARRFFSYRREGRTGRMASLVWFE